MLRVKLRENEETLMQVLWDHDEPMCSMEIIAALPPGTWGANSDKNVHKITRELQKKRMIEVCGQIRHGAHYARQFSPTITREAFAIQQLSGYESDSLQKISLGLSKLADVKRQKGNSQEEREKIVAELQKIIEELDVNRADGHE